MPWLASENENTVRKLLNSLISYASQFVLSLKNSLISETLLNAVENLFFFLLGSEMLVLDKTLYKEGRMTGGKRSKHFCLHRSHSGDSRHG